MGSDKISAIKDVSFHKNQENYWNILHIKRFSWGFKDLWLTI